MSGKTSQKPLISGKPPVPKFNAAQRLAASRRDPTKPASSLFHKGGYYHNDHLRFTGGGAAGGGAAGGGGGSGTVTPASGSGGGRSRAESFASGKDDERSIASVSSGVPMHLVYREAPLPKGGAVHPLPKVEKKVTATPMLKGWNPAKRLAEQRGEVYDPSSYKPLTREAFEERQQAEAEQRKAVMQAKWLANGGPERLAAEREARAAENKAKWLAEHAHEEKRAGPPPTLSVFMASIATAPAAAGGGAAAADSDSEDEDEEEGEGEGEGGLDLEDEEAFPSLGAV